MSETSRLRLLSQAWIDHAPTCGKHTLRPITAGSIELLISSGNPIFSDASAGDGKPTISETTALFEFVWVHTAPLAEVAAAYDDHSMIKIGARLLGLEITMEQIEDFATQFTALQSRVTASIAEVIPEKSQPGKPVAPEPSPTGSPPTSTPSVDPPAQSVSIISFGDCPSSAASNTSTLPTTQTIPPPAGASEIWEQPETPEPPPAVTPLP